MQTIEIRAQFGRPAASLFALINHGPGSAAASGPGLRKGNGGGGIRTHGTAEPPSGFQDRCADHANAFRPNGLRQSFVTSTAPGQRAAPTDPDLATVVDAWDRLPEAVRAGIVAMVRAARG